jgi:hypothetical protein
MTMSLRMQATSVTFLSLGDQAFVESLDGRIVLRGSTQARHVDGVADPAAATLDVALATPLFAVVVICIKAAKSAAPVSSTLTLRTRDRAAIGFLVIIITSQHSGIASSSATAARPTCPVPPRIIATKFCFITGTSA